MNIAGDLWTEDQLNFAYAAAATVDNFSLFLSFDHAANDGAFGGSFTAANITNYINTFKGKPAQYLYNGAPVASTFEGPAHAADWASVKAATGCFFIPDWTSIKGRAATDPSLFANVDGALSWDVWPNGPTGISTMIDSDWKSILGDKVYMMGVSPWFYTNLPAYSKNWLWRGDNLWHDRWQQVLEVQPEMVEILTWNDYGESHYIGPLHASNNYPTGSETYAAQNPHDAWRDLLPYYIAAYKNGNSSSIPVTEEKIIWAHKPNPANSGSSSGTVGNSAQNGQTTYAPGQLNLDAINLDVIVQEPSEVTVQIGNNPPSVWQANVAGPNHFLVYWDGQTGTVTYKVSRNGQTVLSATGATITPDCVNGVVNWNAIVGSSS